MMLLPLVLFPAQWKWTPKWRESTEDQVLFYALLATSLLLCVPSSRAGMGPHHLLPLTVYAGYLFCTGMAKSPPWIRLSPALIVFAIWGLFSCREVIHTGRLVYNFLVDPGLMVQADLRQLLQKYPATDTQMGLGSSDGYEINYAPWIYRAGTPRVAEILLFEDMKVSGLHSDALQSSLAAEQFRYWLIPRGDRPFTIDSAYGTGPIFDDSVGQLFLQHYAKIDTTAYFDVYQAKAGAP
jgi:hypothetical protein